VIMMISSEDCFRIWAPDGNPWSAWAKPVLFASVPGFVTDRPFDVPPLDVPGLPVAWHQTAVILDLRGDESVRLGLAFAGRGFRPVPLYNGTEGPDPVVKTDGLVSALGAGSEVLKTMRLAKEARPVFLLDANRRDADARGLEGRYDNRWMVLPQDFPSAGYLKSQGISSCTLIQRGPHDPAQDLAHVLLRWQQGGITIRSVELTTQRVIDPLIITPPSSFRRAWYAAIALLGLRRSNVGGFGANVPEHQTRSGFYG
jgi:hypothetical protein